jgi:Tol biopolymer transport system component
VLDGLTARLPHFLPGGRQFLFYGQGPPSAAGIYLGSLDNPQTKRLATAESAAVYSDGWVFFVRAGALLAQRFGATAGELTGDPVPVGDAVGFDVSVSGFAGISAANGLIAYRFSGTSWRQLTWFDRSGKALGVMGPPDDSDMVTPSLLPDGQRAVVWRRVQGNTDIYLVDSDRATRFTFDASLERYPILSPDGRRIVFDSNPNGVRNLYIKAASGAGGAELLLETPQNKSAQNWSSDGRFISFNSLDRAGSWDVWILPLDGDRKPFPFQNTPFDERRGMFSPNMRWMAYQSNEHGSYEIYVREFPGPGGQRQVSTAGGINPKWSHDGREIYYITPDGKLMATPITVNGDAIVPGTPAPLFATRIVGGGTDINGGLNYDVTADGRFLINTVLEDSAVSPITLLLNWKPPSK